MKKCEALEKEERRAHHREKASVAAAVGTGIVPHYQGICLRLSLKSSIPLHRFIVQSVVADQIADDNVDDDDRSGVFFDNFSFIVLPPLLTPNRVNAQESDSSVGVPLFRYQILLIDTNKSIVDGG